MLIDDLSAALEQYQVQVHERLGELCLTVPCACWLDVAILLRDDARFSFEQCVDLCGVDYQTYPHKQPARFAVVLHLLSITYNRRLRVRTFITDEEFPVVASLVDVWNSVNWFEREAFDLFGIIFEGHPDLRRILTDYGFVGHPFRKDFPVSGHVEVHYDDTQKRVVYRPVSIEPREIVPRVVREQIYGQ